MRTAILYSPIDPAGEQGPLGSARSVISLTHVLPPWAQQLPHLGPALCHSALPVMGIYPGMPLDVTVTQPTAWASPHSGPAPAPPLPAPLAA